MIDDIQNLSVAEQEKLIARRRFVAYFFKCIGGVVVATMAITLFAIFMISDFSKAFTPDYAEETAGRTLTAFLLLLMFMLGIYALDPKNSRNVKNFWLSVIMIVITFLLVITCCLKFNSRYAMPIALASLVVLQLVSPKASILTAAITGLLVIFSFVFSPEAYNLKIARIVSAAICNSLSPIIISFFARKHYTRLEFLLVSLLVPLLILPLVLMITLVNYDGETPLLYLNPLWYYGGNAFSAVGFMFFVAFFEGIFNIPDDFRLSELCNLSNPLLKRLASEAPGTFNHSLVVGTLSESCASAIGENPNLARCAAYYHDIGKLKAPLYFSENQSDYNPHDELIPEVSVSMITSHTLFGEILAKQNRLPKEVVDICRQHHGTSPVGYFYRKALSLNEDEQLAMEKYKYSGPKPQTKIAAIVMITDTVEAAIRAYIPNSLEEYESRIDALVDEKVKLKQFDECPLTMSDISVIKKTVIYALASMHHSRIDYDKSKRRKAQSK
ncbi:MAG: HDIG domain-containing protein [Bacteroides sp.]|nr:HDIG domain-containing protein [Bacillota bacterium]MCM1455596.1 HDIG domain-containing protein [Bacteroides sp.]